MAAAICGSKANVRRALWGVEAAMFGIPNARIAELSRPDYPRDLAEFARLEYPREEPRAVLAQALAAVGRPAPRPRFRLRFLRPVDRTTEVSSAKA